MKLRENDLAESISSQCLVIVDISRNEISAYDESVADDDDNIAYTQRALHTALYLPVFNICTVSAVLVYNVPFTVSFAYNSVSA